MYIFKGLDLSMLHIRPETMKWLENNYRSLDCPLDYSDNEFGWIIWVWSVYEDDEAI